MRLGVFWGGGDYFGDEKIVFKKSKVKVFDEGIGFGFRLTFNKKVVVGIGGGGARVGRNDVV